MGDRGQSIYADGDINIFGLCLERENCRSTIDTSRLQPFYKLFRSFRVPSNMAPLLRRMGSGPFLGNEDAPALSVIPEANFDKKKFTGDIHYLFHKNESIWGAASTSDFDDCPFVIHDFEAKCEMYRTKVRDYEIGQQTMTGKKRPRYPSDVARVFGADASLAMVMKKMQDIHGRMVESASQVGPRFILGTVHAFKGAEFETWRVGSDVWESGHKAKNRRIQNVALTRGTKTVIIDGDVGEELKLLTTICQLPTELRMKIAEFMRG